jgi:cytoskeletal protein RodZ
MATLGQQLKNAREEKGISLHDIANTTHIGVRFLQAIENDTYDILPGGVFNRAFVRKFAKQVGFDEEQAVKLYEDQLDEQGGEPQRRFEYGVEDFEPKPSSGNGLLLSFVALLILGSLAYAAYQYFAPAIREPEPERLGNISTPTPAPVTTPTPASSVSPVASPSPAASPSVTPTPEAAPAGAMRLQLAATGEEVWLSVKPDAGKTEKMMLQPGDMREYNVSDKVVLYIGRVHSLRITINGRVVDYGKLLPNLRGAVASNVVITKDNYQQYLN